MKDFFQKKVKNSEIKNEIDEIKKWEKETKQKDLIFKTNKYRYDFQQYETIRSFGESIYTGKINIDEAEVDQSNLLRNLVEFNEQSRPKTTEGKYKKRNIFESVNALYEDRELILNAFRSGILAIKQISRKGCPLELATQLKILTPKQMLQRLPIALAQVKAVNISKTLLNEIRQITYSLYGAKEITKENMKQHNEFRYNTKMNIIFINSKNSKTSDPDRLLLNITDKIDLRRKDKYIALSNLSIYCT